MIQEPETRHAWNWREYKPKPWPSVPTPLHRRLTRKIVAVYDAYSDWLNAVHIRTVVAWAFIGGLLAAGTTFLAMKGQM